jgi:hypothetical protein
VGVEFTALPHPCTAAPTRNPSHRDDAPAGRHGAPCQQAQDHPVIGVIVQAAIVLSFLPGWLQQSGWAVAVTRSGSRCSGRPCPGCASTPATGTAPTCRRWERPAWCCWRSGRHTENHVDVDELVRQGKALTGFWVGLSQLPRSHPFTVRRLERLYRLGLFHARLRGAESEAPV